MLYVYVDSHKVRLLFLKKSLLGQYEVSFFDKKHSADLLKTGEINNLDLFASALKEGLNALNITSSQETTLILPQESFDFLIFKVPQNYSANALSAFVRDKVKAELATDMTEYAYDSLVSEGDNEQEVMTYAIKGEVVATFAQALKLLNLKLVGVLPEALCLFKLFEKTLRKEKKEDILYASYDEGEVTGYLFNSLGLASKKRWTVKTTKDKTLQEVLKSKVAELKEQNIKLNRIILSGPKSEGIRQDTFTKEAGVWTNPLKRIIPHFYQDYLKALVTTEDASFPILTFDACFGAFVFNEENKKFNILKNYSHKLSRGTGASIKIPFVNKKTFAFLLIFVISFVASFFALYGLSKAGVISTLTNSFQSKPKPTPTPESKEATTNPKSSPTPSFSKEKLRIKVLNGSGTPGLASQAKDVLTEKGYEEVLTGNADTFDYEQTTIEVKKNVKDAATVLKKDLSDSVENPKVTTSLDEKETSDVIITLGTDFK